MSMCMYACLLFIFFYFRIGGMKERGSMSNMQSYSPKSTHPFMPPIQRGGTTPYMKHLQSYSFYLARNHYIVIQCLIKYSLVQSRARSGGIGHIFLCRPCHPVLN